MAGTWISIVHGFAGMRDSEGRLSFSPRLPRAWRRLRFRLRVRGRLIQATFTQDTATYLLREGAPMTITHRGRDMDLAAGQETPVDLRPRLDCVIFDLDGVLTDTAELHFRAWERLCTEEGIPFNRDVNEQLRGVGRQDSLRIILRDARVPKSDDEVELLAARKNGYYGELIEHLTPKDLLPGIPSLLSALREAGIRIAVASASRNAPQILERLGIRGHVDHLVDAAGIVKGKPDPEIFFKAAEGAGAAVQDCAGVEDAVVGIQAIKAAGMFAVGIGKALIHADWVLPDTRGLTLEELRSRFESARRAPPAGAPYQTQ
jgi:alpha,alpha-trehalose phosphorylase